MVIRKKLNWTVQRTMNNYCHWKELKPVGRTQKKHPFPKQATPKPPSGPILEQISILVRANPGDHQPPFTAKALGRDHGWEHRERLVENITWRLIDSLHQNVANGNCPWLREAGNRPFARWRHFTTTTRILQDFVFLCKLGLFYLNLAGITEFKYERNNEKDSGHSSKMTPSCKWLIYIRTNIT